MINKQNADETTRQKDGNEKKSSCCGPTCCTETEDKKNINRKDKSNADIRRN